MNWARHSVILYPQISWHQNQSVDGWVISFCWLKLRWHWWSSYFSRYFRFWEFSIGHVFLHFHFNFYHTKRLNDRVIAWSIKDGFGGNIFLRYFRCQHFRTRQAILHPSIKFPQNRLNVAFSWSFFKISIWLLHAVAILFIASYFRFWSF